MNEIICSEDLEDARDEFEPEKRKRKNLSSESIALIANNCGTGCVLTYDGKGISYFIETSGSVALDDLGLDDAPEGLSIWEGRVKCYDSYFGDHDEELEGNFRELYYCEWQRLAQTGEPWEYIEEK